MLPHAKKLLAQADSLHALGSNLAMGGTGIVAVSCAHPHVQRFLAPLLGNYHRRNPEVQISVHEYADLPSTDRALTGEVDFVTTLLRADARLQGHRLGEVRLALVVPDDHPWRHRGSVQTTELEGKQLLTGRPGGLTRHLLEPTLRMSGISVSYMLESPNAASVVALAREGLGIGVLADDNLRPDPGGPWPVLVDEAHSMTAEIWLYWSREHVLEPAARDFARYVQESTAKQAMEPRLS